MSEAEDRRIRREDLQGSWAMEAQENLQGPEEEDRAEELREFGLACIRRIGCIGCGYLNQGVQR